MLSARNNSVVILPQLIEEKTVSGIILPSPKPKNRTGIVQSVGAEVNGISNGARVAYFENNAVNIDGYQIVPDENVFCELGNDIKLNP